MKWFAAASAHRKPLPQAIGELEAGADGPTLRRVLGPVDLLLAGVGIIVGGGIFVVTGTAAAQYAGPAVVLSFLLAGLGCALTGVCYAELSAMIPTAGSAYAFAYSAFGELAAWIVGWSLLAEYIFAASYVSVGWSAYLASLLSTWGVALPASITGAPVMLTASGSLHSGTYVNAPAALLGAGLSVLTCRGVRISSVVNSTIVALKMGALLLVVVVGWRYVQGRNWIPFVPPNEGPFGQYGWSGVLRAAAIVFVSYLGFDAIATLAQDTRNPQRDVPIGILGSLGAVTLLYIAVSLILTGLVSYHSLNVPNPLSVALQGAGTRLIWLLPVVDLAAVVGLASVVLVIMLAAPRILMAMGHDGLLPEAMGRVHSRFRTPAVATLVCGICVAILAGLFPLAVLVQLVSVGTLLVFISVALGVLVFRRREPERIRPFRAPLVPLVPLAGALVCAYLLTGIPLLTWGVYMVWIGVGILIYALYGKRSAMRRRGGL
jgi:basic amino acid/polyamine antiporter, APA family